ncbi:hypothetical protein FNV43_RR13313 [Rhamnella rubrinervis]|uniref:Pentatricopeptide repeat-containing protein n=1 Tax=Rhamnella rubrinervis TaxID=2594499 RepID=A0A8K0H106_9ROSA|nr:hypothetical protein FNV43_RR13313 [Rhamnella rubrinervis]
MTLLFFTARPLWVRASKTAIAHFMVLPTEDLALGPTMTENLTPSLAFEVIKRLNNPRLGLKFFEFTRMNLSMSHTFWTYDFLMRSDGHSPDYSIIEFLVFSYAQIGKLDIAAKLLEEVHSDAVTVSAIAYNKSLNVLVKRNQVHVAISLFRKTNEVDKGCRLLKEVQLRKELSPNVITFTSVISGYCKLGRMKEASILFAKMLTFGIKPNAITFNALIDGFGKAGEMGSALFMQLNQGVNLWHQMNARNIPPNGHTFVLIQALCKVNRLDEARDFLRQLKWVALFQNLFVQPVIDGFCKAGNIDEANIIVWERWRKRDAGMIKGHLPFS